MKTIKTELGRIVKSDLLFTTIVFLVGIAVMIFEILF